MKYQTYRRVMVMPRLVPYFISKIYGRRLMAPVTIKLRVI